MSAATYLRWDGRNYSRIFHSSSLTATVKELLKSVRICQSYPLTLTAYFFWPTLYITIQMCLICQVTMWINWHKTSFHWRERKTVCCLCNEAGHGYMPKSVTAKSTDNYADQLVCFKTHTHTQYVGIISNVQVYKRGIEYRHSLCNWLQ